MFGNSYTSRQSNPALLKGQSKISQPTGPVILWEGGCFGIEAASEFPEGRGEGKKLIAGGKKEKANRENPASFYRESV